MSKVDIIEDGKRLFIDGVEVEGIVTVSVEYKEHNSSLFSPYEERQRGQPKLTVTFTPDLIEYEKDLTEHRVSKLGWSTADALGIEE